MSCQGFYHWGSTTAERTIWRCQGAVGRGGQGVHQHAVAAREARLAEPSVGIVQQRGKPREQLSLLPVSVGRSCCTPMR